MNTGMRRMHIWVSGRVQGVCFRDFTRRTATALQLEGWVRNLPDGRVEIVAEGPAAGLARLREAVSEGPPGAWVDKTEAREEACSGEFRGFETTG